MRLPEVGPLGIAERVARAIAGRPQSGRLTGILPNPLHAGAPASSPFLAATKTPMTSIGCISITSCWRAAAYRIRTATCARSRRSRNWRECSRLAI